MNTPAAPIPDSPFVPDAAFEEAEKGTSLWKDAWARLRKNKMAVFGAGTLIFVALFCLIGPFISPHTYDAQDLNQYAKPPSAQHWFGTDKLGRDQLTRIMYGGRISLAVGLAATIVSLTIGVLYGAVAGFVGGKPDNVMMRIVDILYALPFTIFVILLTVMLKEPMNDLDSFLKNSLDLKSAQGWGSMILLFAAIGAVEWLTMARIVRGQVRALRKMEFIEAAIALGLSRRRIILRHMIPNVLGPVMVYTTLTIPAVMLLEAFLSFLGLGVQPPMSSWGSMIKDGAEVMEEFWWMLIIPGLFLSLTLFSLNFLGDGLRDALDPKASKD